jgi:hypothetical protein
MGIDYFTKDADLTLDSGNTNVLALSLLLAFNESTGITVRDWARFGEHAMMTGTSEGNWVDRGTSAYALRVNDGEGILTNFKIPRVNRPVMGNDNSARTWAFWVRSERIGIRPGGAAADTFGYFYFRQTGNQSRVERSNESFDYFDQVVWQQDLSSSESGVLNCWVFTADSSSSGLRIYKNGDLIYGPAREGLFQTGNAHWIFNSNATTNYGIEGELFMTAEWDRELSPFDVDTITTNPLVEMGIDIFSGAEEEEVGSTVTNTHSVGPDQPQIWAGGAGAGSVISEGAMDAKSEMGFGQPQAHILDWLGGAD